MDPAKIIKKRYITYINFENILGQAMSIPQSGGGTIEHYDQLVYYLSDGCKPKSEWKVGTEHEKFGFFKDTLKPIPYDGTRSRQ